ncbi:MAG: phenylalanine--tRNA ligase subunit alpha [Alphaproteobacteria bacterium]
MTADLDQVQAELIAAVEAAADLDGLEAARVAAVGRKGRVGELMQALGKLPAEERRDYGQAVNALKTAVEAAIETRRGALEASALDARLAAERIDLSLPARPEAEGRIHPISQTIDEVVEIFGQMGFRVAEGPDIEDDWKNFTALNIPPEHPARQEMDTFYLHPHVDGSRPVLRTHTSPVQIRTMMTEPPPIRVIVPGRTFRSDHDATHSPMFHQVEGLVIDEATHMGHLKGCLIEFCRTFFEIADLPVRFRNSHFPFTEPSAEVDIGCTRSDGALTIGHGDDWLEILGSGMVHPKVIANCGLDPEKYQGFAFGMGIERIAMLKYGIPDLRTFYDSDLRWLRHYGFAALDIPGALGGLHR